MGNLHRVRCFALIALLPLLHWSTAQQSLPSAQYSQRLPNGKTQLEDLEQRDSSGGSNNNYKSTAAEIYHQTQSALSSSPQQQATSQQQQPSTVTTTNQVAPIYASNPSQSQVPFLLTPQYQLQQQQPQHQYLFQPYLNSQSYPVALDFVNLPLPYLSNLLSSPIYQQQQQQQYYIPSLQQHQPPQQQTQQPQQLQQLQQVGNYLTAADYYKSVAAGQQASTTPSLQKQVTPLKPVSSAQSVYQNYITSSLSSPQQYYQQTHAGLGQQPSVLSSPYYYNTIYQPLPSSQYPQQLQQQKNVFSTGVKSSTPSSLSVKGREDSGESGYKFEYPEQQQSILNNKVRYSSG